MTIGLQRARRLDRLQDRDDSRWLQADLVQTTHQALQIHAAQDRDLRARLVDVDECLRDHDRLAALENGEGWETTGGSVTRTVRLPCVTATVDICTSRPITTVPVRSLMTTRAGVSGSTRQLADLGDEANRRDRSRLRQHDRSIIALEGELGWYRHDIMVDGVEDSRRRHEIRILQLQNQEFHIDEVALTSRSISAPFGIRPDVGDTLVDGLRLRLRSQYPATVMAPCATA